MRIPAAYLTVGLLISATNATPLPQDMEPDLPVASPETSQLIASSSTPSTLANLALAGLSTALLFGTGIGLSEWGLNWFTRFQRNKQSQSQQNQTVQDDRLRRQEQWARRERAMDLVLGLAEKYSEKVAAEKDFNGNFEPFVVPGAIVGAVGNVFEQTGEEGLEGLEGLKKALKPLLEFKRDDRKKV